MNESAQETLLFDSHEMANRGSRAGRYGAGEVFFLVATIVVASMMFLYPSLGSSSASAGESGLATGASIIISTVTAFYIIMGRPGRLFGLTASLLLVVIDLPVIVFLWRNWGRLLSPASSAIVFLLVPYGIMLLVASALDFDRMRVGSHRLRVTSAEIKMPTRFSSGESTSVPTTEISRMVFLRNPGETIPFAFVLVRRNGMRLSSGKRPRAEMKVLGEVIQGLVPEVWSETDA